MAERLVIVIVEDSEADAELLVRQLRSHGLDFEHERVDTEAAFRATLVRGRCPDIVLADYSLPRFDARTALRILRVKCPLVPFVVVSGAIDDDVAVALMREGASDYVLKDRLARLGPAVEQMLQQRRLREQALAAEGQFRSFVRNAVFGIYSVTLDGRFLQVNPALVQMLGFASETELLATNINDLYRDPHTREHLIARHADDARFEGVETEWIRKDGQPIRVRVSGRYVRGPGGAIQGLESIVEDVTARHSLELQFRRAQKMEALGRLAGGIAHDFNNLLTAILGYAELALASLPADGPLAADLREIQAAAERAAQLTRQLLTFSRHDAANVRVVHLSEVVNGMERMLRRLLGEDIHLEVTGEGGTVRADPGHIEQVVMNLAVNARDAMPMGGVLVVRTVNVVLDEVSAAAMTVKPGPYVQLVVSDTGHGMDGETQARIFEPFFTTKEEGRGTGLGLSTVYAIVTQSGGHITLESERGRGTTFTIWLPYVDAPADGSLPAATRPSAATGTETILLVEDDPGVRALLGTVLRRQGYQVVEAEDGQQALDLVERGDIEVALVVTDVVMPEMGGAALGAWLRLVRPEAKVLYLSGYGEEALLVQGIGELDALLRKPFSSDAFLIKVREVLEHPPGRRPLRGRPDAE